MTAELTDGENKPLETWNTETRTRLSPNSIHNDFAYNKFKASPYGIERLVFSAGQLCRHDVGCGPVPRRHRIHRHNRHIDPPYAA
jgi:hypothetical protein